MPQMLNATAVTMLASISAANTAAATSTGFDLTGFEGAVLVTANVGAITGSFAALKVQGSTDNSVWNDLSGAVGTILSGNASANTSYAGSVDVRRVITSAGLCRYLRFIGTVTTGPVLLSVSLVGFKKSSS